MKIKSTLTILCMLAAFMGFSQTISLTPNNANKGQSLPVSITGIGTNFSRGSNTITFIRQGTSTTEVTLSNLTVISNNLMGGLLNVSSSAVAGAYTVRVTNSQNATVNLTNGFTVNNTSSTPSLVSVTPNTGMQGQTLAVSITGLNTNFSSGSNTVKFFSQGTESFDFYELSNSPINNNLLSASIIIDPSAPTGVYSVGVENNIDGLVMLNNSFTVTQNNKSITTVAPNNGTQGQTLNVTITGLNTNFTTGSPSFYFIRQGSPTSDIQTLNITATSATQANVQISIDLATLPGLYDVGYYNINDGALIKANAFTVNKAVSTLEINKATAQIYPNPASQVINIASNQTIEEVTIIDVTGRLVATKKPENKQTTIELNIGDLQIPKGIYIVKVQGLKGLVTKKIVIE
ncbi:MAG: T9SS type A sorting domain-containing protein [Bacteroidia bacterium]|nr:T9SS type A sorting domain-containing protein [Bacteroidia bacterium]